MRYEQLLSNKNTVMQWERLKFDSNHLILRECFSDCAIAEIRECCSQVVESDENSVLTIQDRIGTVLSLTTLIYEIHVFVSCSFRVQTACIGSSMGCHL